MSTAACKNPYLYPAEFRVTSTICSVGDRIGLHRVVQLRARTNQHGVVIVEYLIESELLNERHWISEIVLKLKLQNAQVTE